MVQDRRADRRGQRPWLLVRGAPPRLVAAVVLAAGLSAAVVDARDPSKLPLVAILDSGSVSAPTPAPWISGFVEALAGRGWVDGRTVRLVWRHADHWPDRMRVLAREVVVLEPDVIFTHGPPAMIRSVAQATSTIPIVVGAAGDLVAEGLAQSLARPGGNVTGMTLLYDELELKRLATLIEAVPGARRVGILVDAAATDLERRLRSGADSLGVELAFEAVAAPAGIRGALTALKRQGAQVLLVQDVPLLAQSAPAIAEQALAMRLPSISQSPRFAVSGGLLQLGADILDTFRRSAGHVDRILRGAKPEDLPIEQPAKLRLTVNLRTAAALGLAIPRAVLLRADRLIE